MEFICVITMNSDQDSCFREFNKIQKKKKSTKYCSIRTVVIQNCSDYYLCIPLAQIILHAKTVCVGLEQKD